MSGHSKWSTIKRQKQLEDQKRGQIFTKLARAITLAVREAGGNTDSTANFKLRLAMEQARHHNMPKDNIQRAIDRGSGKGDANEMIESVIYEGYGPAGVAVVIESATDNKQRTSAQIKHLLEHAGGSLGSSGSVVFQFDNQGMIMVAKDTLSEESILELAVGAGASDVETAGDSYQIYTEREKLHEIKEKIRERGVPILACQLIFRPKLLVPVQNNHDASALSHLLEDLEDLDDVQEIFHNASIDQSLKLS